MKIRHISIRNYRGIKILDWKVNSDFTCLIGSGDSTKSTILDAIECALTPRWNCVFEDTDFYNLDVTQNINMNITLGQLPNLFISEQKYGLFLRGWSNQSELHDEPEEGDEPVITISLQVDKGLEPKWLIVNERLQDERMISSADRSQIGVSRLGSYTSKHLSWSSGSALSSMTGEDLKINELMADTVRRIRNSFDMHSINEIQQTVQVAKTLGEKLGVVSKNEIKAHLDIKKLSVKESGVCLHDGNVPLRLSGIGTQRLMGLALQTGLQEKGGISLIDEIEYGLEPHRICQVLKYLETLTGTNGQMFITTHSPCVLQELDIKNIKIVFSENGVTTIKDIIDDTKSSFQKLIRTNPFAFLAKKVVVCEGNTEIGLLRGIDQSYIENSERGMWTFGVALANGKGDASFDMAKRFKELRYDVVWFGDSDLQSAITKKQDLVNLGISVVSWADSLNTESRLFSDLPWEGVKDIVKTAIDLNGKQQIISNIKIIKDDISDNIESWVDSQELRNTIGKAASQGSWYKNVTNGELMGYSVASYLNSCSSTDLAKKIEIIRKWIKNDEHGTASS